MKFRITEGANQYDGSPMFYVYEWLSGECRWAYRMGAPREEECRGFVDRQGKKVPERVIEDIEVPTL